jgi:hypothetical protein
MPKILDNDIIRQCGNGTDMIKMGMGYENMLEPPLFLFAQHGTNRAGIQQQVIVDQKRRGSEVGEFCSGASQYP